MEIPRQLRKQIIEYGKAGFHARSIEPRNGSHFKVMFAEINEPQFITKNADDWRSIKNNVAHYRRMTTKETT
jgi:hypothetical protein